MQAEKICNCVWDNVRTYIYDGYISNENSQQIVILTVART